MGKLDTPDLCAELGGRLQRLVPPARQDRQPPDPRHHQSDDQQRQREAAHREGH
jgi:hypothetical protein